MVGSALRKLAKEHNMTVSDGIAYGAFHGYAVTFFEGNGYKAMIVTTKFQNLSDQDALERDLNTHNLKKEFRILNLELMEDGVAVTFHDNPGTMKRINAFVDYFFPLLASTSALGVNYCSECGIDRDYACVRRRIPQRNTDEYRSWLFVCAAGNVRYSAEST